MGNKEQATRKMKQEIRTEEQATGNRQKIKGDKERGTVYR